MAETEDKWVPIWVLDVTSAATGGGWPASSIIKARQEFEDMEPEGNG